MELDFNIENVTATEFGVGRDNEGDQHFVLVPVDAGVQSALREMVHATWERMQGDEDGPRRYEPSEKYGPTERLYLPLEDSLASRVRELHEAEDLQIDVHALDDPDDVFCYFTRLTDERGRRLTALRRAKQFKGVLKSRLIRLTTDALHLIEDRVFKLDVEFGLLGDSKNVYILRPTTFVSAAGVQQAILGAAHENVEAIEGDLPFVNMDLITEYASSHPRAASYLASIRSGGWSKGIDVDRLEDLCRRTSVGISVSDGRISVQPGCEMAFLEVLDRRRYELELVRESPERFMASSRRKLPGGV